MPEVQQTAGPISKTLSQLDEVLIATKTNTSDLAVCKNRLFTILSKLKGATPSVDDQREIADPCGLVDEFSVLNQINGANLNEIASIITELEQVV